MAFRALATIGEEKDNTVTTVTDLTSDKARFPRVSLAQLWTPLQELKRFRDLMGPACPRLWIKRDDCTGLAGGGNKTRKLEFLMGQAQQVGAKTVITIGAIQSNHVRQTAAAAAALGFNCEAVLIDMVDRQSPSYRNNGNLMLDKILGAAVHYVSLKEVEEYCETLVARHQTDGEGAYFIPAGGSNEVGALGYGLAMDELIDQANAEGIHIDAVVHASSSGGTQAGLELGAALRKYQTRVLGVNVYHEKAHDLVATVKELADSTAALIGANTLVSADTIEVIDGFRGLAYGQPSQQMRDAVLSMAQSEGILLDPVYTGKGFAALIELINQGAFRSSDNVIFLHTGGAPSLAAYDDVFGDDLVG